MQIKATPYNTQIRIYLKTNSSRQQDTSADVKQTLVSGGDGRCITPCLALPPAIHI
jgi:hypothetical protein